jgi:hypothetical protein
MLGGTKCTPTEREFFIQGYILAVESIRERLEPHGYALFGQPDQ